MKTDAQLQLDITHELATQRVAGVRAVTNDLQVSLPGHAQRSNVDLAHAAWNAPATSTHLLRSDP